MELIFDVSRDYFNFQNKRGIEYGLCWGTTLHWITDTLQKIGNGNPSIEEKPRGRFYKCGHVAQNAYRYFSINSSANAFTDGIVNTLNNQESFLVKKNSHRIKYYKKNSKDTIFAINMMMSGSARYNNYSIIINTKSNKKVFNSSNSVGTNFEHATALLCHRGQCYLFNVNQGLYKISPSDNIDTLLRSIAKDYNLNDPGSYVLNSKPFIHIALLTID